MSDIFNDQFLNDNFWLILIVAVTDYTLKAVALWIAARKSSKVWFVVLLLLNTAGILPLFYIFYFSKHENAAKISETR